MELSEEDLDLINALQIAPRLSWADAAGSWASTPPPWRPAGSG